MANVQPFAFETEFTPAGEVLGGPQRKFVPRDEVDKIAASARVEGETKARQTIEAKGFASVDRIVTHLSPVSAQLAQLADQLRREAAELALIAARKIAGAALDKAGEQVAADAIAQVVRQLKANPVVTVTLAQESIPEVERRIDQLRRNGQAGQLSFVADPNAKPGDWHVEWTDGSVSFNREEVAAAIEAALNARLQDPVEPQLELFSAA
ncbi:MAG TPA: FliH/SctL family protein [Hyphomonadaceae bacterium]|nr:FliH/SctL family protein [Hyphomonadaceae bacterium]